MMAAGILVQARRGHCTIQTVRAQPVHKPIMKLQSEQQQSEERSHQK
jgi:hypothetical protein